MPYRVFRWYDLPLGQTYLVTSLHIAPEHGFATCEAYLLAPKSTEPLRTETFRYGKPDFRLDAAELQMVDLEEFAQGWAAGGLESDLLEWARHHPGSGYPDPPRFAEVPRAISTLAELWLRQWEPESLKHIRARTEDGDLRTDLRKILELPPIVAPPAR